MEAASIWMKPELIWFVVGLVLLLTEFATPGFVMFFFGIGAWVVALACFVFDIGLETQLFIFLVASVFSLLLLRRRLSSLFFGKKAGFTNLKDNVDDYKGVKVKVTRGIQPNVKGKIELHGTNWEAESDQAIPEGAVVEIVELNNLTFKVKPV
jgi:membrane protein implicated in regulation of membrane protease activity